MCVLPGNDGWPFTCASVSRHKTDRRENFPTYQLEKRANKFHCFLLAKKKKVNKIPLYRTAPVDIVRANLVRQRRNPCGRFSVAYPRRQLLSHALEKGAVSCCRSLSIRRLLQIIYSSLWIWFASCSPPALETREREVDTENLIIHDISYLRLLSLSERITTIRHWMGGEGHLLCAFHRWQTLGWLAFNDREKMTNKAGRLLAIYTVK